MAVENQVKEELLKDRRVVEEINRHLWIESEKAGCNIGFEKAAQDWLENFSKAWMTYHMPEKTAARTTAKKSIFSKALRRKA